jgi:hypothetical protein
MKGNKLPAYALVTVIALALAYAVANPPKPELPGPVGDFPGWKSTAVKGTMTAQAVNQDGTMWAGAWTEKAGDDSREAVRVIDLKGFSAKSIELGKNHPVQYLSWGSDGTLRADVGGAQVLLIDPKSEKKPAHKLVFDSVRDRWNRVLVWPAGSDKLVAVLEEEKDNVKMAVFSDSGKMVGKEISFDLPKEASLDNGYGLSDDGSSFVFAVSDPTAGDGKAFYVADTKSGAVKKAFDLAQLPGRIEAAWPSGSGALMVCRVRMKHSDRLEDVLFDSATGKVAVQPKGIALTAWPGAPKTMAYMNYNGGYELDLATGKNKCLFDKSKQNSPDDKGWRDFLSDSRLYKLDGGSYVAISETGGALDIREIKSNGTPARAMLSRM